jgi:hypothetical protein
MRKWLTDILALRCEGDTGERLLLGNLTADFQPTALIQ